MENKRFFLLLWTTAFFNFSSVVSLSPHKSVFLNSIANYNTQAARWTFHLNYCIPSSINKSTIILRVMIELLDHDPSGNTSSLFAVGSKQRFKHIELFGRNSSDQIGNMSIDFDHVYSGHYKLEVAECRNRYSCVDLVHESDLGVVKTHLNNINVTKMNISISTTPNQIGGIDVSFVVKYFNISTKFLPFNEFMVSLFHSDEIHSYSRKVIGETKAQFRPCTNVTSSGSIQGSTGVSTQCFNILNGKYMTRIDPIDPRCNFPDQIVASIKYPCRRYIITNITLIPIGRGGENSALFNTSNPDGEHVGTTVSNIDCLFICQMLNFFAKFF